MKRLILTGAVLLAILAGCWAWGSPYWTVWQLKRASDARDFAAISAHVDYPALRQSLKAQLGERLAHSAPKSELGALASGIARRLAAPAVDAIVTPEGLQTVFATAASRTPNTAEPAGLRAEKMTLRRETFSRFTLRQHDAALIFQLRGIRWMLTDVRLPARLPSRL